MKTTAVLFITILALTCFGCTAQRLDDAGITTKVKSNLAADTETSAIKIGVDTTNSVVTLSGVVPSERERAKAGQIASNTAGVALVINNITVNPDTLSPTNVGEKTEEAITDATILTKIKAKLLTEGITGTNVDVVDGAVTLKGEVESAQLATQAVDIARSTSGVKSINNRLTVRRL